MLYMMKRGTGLAGLLLAIGVHTTMTGVAHAAPESSYKWVTSHPGGAPASGQISVVHGSPRDHTDFNFHLACVPGQNSVILGARTRGFGPHKPASLTGKEVEAKFLVDGRRIAVRASGTEPKVKFYSFTKAEVADADDLTAARDRARKSALALRAWLEVDAKRRAK